jgi:hypothetical protein
VAVVVNTVKIVAFGSNGIEVTVLDGVAVPANTPALIIAGSDGTNARYIRTATDGTVRVDPTGTTTQPISASSLPLPTNAATETSLVAQSIVDNAGFSDAVTRIIPAGFILDETPGTALTENDAAAARIDSKRAIVFALEDESTRGRRLTITAANAAKVDGSGVTQPVSGTVTANQGTAAALAGYWPVRITDGTNTMPTGDAVARALYVRAFGPDADGAAPTNNPVRVAGWDGTDLRTIKTDIQGRVVTVPATGSLSGFANGQIVLNSTAITACRSTTYTEPSSNAQRSIASANANDTSAGTGARTLRITYYSLSAGVITGPFTEDVTLNGTTPVNTVSTTICFIEKIHVLTVGSTGSNVGIITLYGSTAGGGGAVWTIAATASQTFSCHHYVPSGSTCNISGLLLGIKGADTTGGFLRAKNPADANAAEIQISDNLRAPSSGQSFRSYSTPIDVAGPSRITGYIAADSTSSRTYYMSFDFYEE